MSLEAVNGVMQGAAYPLTRDAEGQEPLLGPAVRGHFTARRALRGLHPRQRLGRVQQRRNRSAAFADDEEPARGRLRSEGDGGRVRNSLGGGVQGRLGQGRRQGEHFCFVLIAVFRHPLMAAVMWTVARSPC